MPCVLEFVFTNSFAFSQLSDFFNTILIKNFKSFFVNASSFLFASLFQGFLLNLEELFFLELFLF